MKRVELIDGNYLPVNQFSGTRTTAYLPSDVNGNSRSLVFLIASISLSLLILVPEASAALIASFAVAISVHVLAHTLKCLRRSDFSQETL